MAKYSIDDTTLKAIADAIRSKDGTAALLTPAAMAAAISALSVGGGGIAIDLPNGYAVEVGVLVPETDITSTAYEIHLQNVYKFGADNTSAGAFMVCVDHVKGQNTAIASMVVKAAGGSTQYRNVCASASGSTTSSTNFVTVTSSDLYSGKFDTLQLKGTSTYVMRAGLHYVWMIGGALYDG